MFDSQVKSINYTIKTANGIVYIVGSARSQAELERVTGYARNIPNVRKVVTYVRIRSGEPSAAGGAAAAPPARRCGSAAGATGTGCRQRGHTGRRTDAARARSRSTPLK